MITEKMLAEWREQSKRAMVSALSEYCPEEFTQLLDEFERKGSTSIIELSSGHVFAMGAIKAITPVFGSSIERYFKVVGVGFEVSIDVRGYYKNEERIEALRKEAIEKLL